MKSRPECDAWRTASPVVVGGMGGSGTRVVARILRWSGRYMGVNVNGPKEDALDFADFDYRWAPPFLAALRDATALGEARKMEAEFNDVLRRFLGGRGDVLQPWGWKHSPSIHLLPFLNTRFPALHFIHVIRDGRDMAFGTSGGRTHTLRLGRAVLDGDPTPVTAETPTWRARAAAADGGAETSPLRLILFWNAVHSAAADYAEAKMSGRYMRIRLEDLCRAPDAHVRKIIDFVGCSGDREAALAAARSVIVTPDSLGRWRDAEPDLVTEVTRSVGESLHRFGYGFGAGGLVPRTEGQ